MPGFAAKSDGSLLVLMKQALSMGNYHTIRGDAVLCILGVAEHKWDKDGRCEALSKFVLALEAVKVGPNLLHHLQQREMWQLQYFCWLVLRRSESKNCVFICRQKCWVSRQIL